MSQKDNLKPAFALGRAKERVREAVIKALGDADAVVNVEYPPPNIAADLAVPCFPYAKVLRKSPKMIAEELSGKVEMTDNDYFDSVGFVGGFLNFNLNKSRIAEEVKKDFDRFGENYGGGEDGKGKTMVIDYSSPNIAKPFSVGNIRSTITGRAIYNIYKTIGYKVVGDNHLGDWGTQFGKLIYAYKQWGDEEKIKQDPIKELLNLYVRFHKEAKTDEKADADTVSGNELLNEARSEFNLLEQKDPDNTKIWEWFKEISLSEFERIYNRLGVTFDAVLGESFYNDKTDEVIDLVEEAGIAEQEEEGPLLVRLDEHGIKTPVLLRKSDGATLYATRELASLIYRIREFEPDLLVYVVGSEQKLHFKQAFKVLELLGFKTRCVHVDFGLVTLKEGKMSTREGRVIFFEDVLDEGVQRARDILKEKRPELSGEEREEIAEVVGIGAIKFNDLSQNRIKNVVFDWDKMLSFEGDSAPYLQYSYARVRSILRKAEIKGEIVPELVREKEEAELLNSIARFPEAVREAAKDFEPHVIARYLLDTARVFTQFYSSVPVLKAETESLVKSRLGLIEAYAFIVRKGLSILGIDVLERM